MQGLVRTALRLVVMVVVTAAVLVAATALGLPMAAVLGLAITMAGLVGMLGLARRGRDSGASRETIEIADVGALRAERTSPERASADRTAPTTAASATESGDGEDPLVASMAPGQDLDPELLMPRWRRPSLLAARKADPMRTLRAERMPMRFTQPANPGTSRRIIRYAVVQLLDRPDEVLGRQLSDLMSGDEVEVLDPSGSFWEVACPDGMVGWVHRTTLGAIGSEPAWASRRETEPDDLLTAVLSARGIQ